MSEFRILDYNYAFDPSVSLEATSEATDFPVSNLANHNRSDVWRSSGFFVITSSNKYLDFNEGGGEKNAVLYEGNYSASALATHIAERIVAAGGSTYAITQSSLTGLWTITISAGTFTLLWSTGANSANSVGSMLGFDVSADSSSANAHTGAAIALHTEEAVTIDLMTSEEIDSVAILFDPVDGPKLSEAAVVKLQANATVNWTSPAVDVTLSLDTTFDILTHRFSTAQEYRYWRIKIVDPTNANLHVEISKVILAKATQLGQVPSIGFVQNMKDTSRPVVNDFGARYFDVYPSQRMFTFNHLALSEADLQTLFDIYKRVGNVTPICLWLDASATVYDKDRFFIYGRLEGDFKATHSFYTFFDNELSLVEAL